MKELNPKDFVLPSHKLSEEAFSGMTVPVNQGWHDIETLKPVKRRVVKEKANPYGRSYL